MWLSKVGEWLLSFFNNDRFLDWFFTTLLGFFLWLPASIRHFRSKITWPITSYRNKQEKMLYVRSYITQKIGLLAMLLSLMLAFAVADHQQRVNLYAWGLFALLVLGFCIVIFVELTS